MNFVEQYYEFKHKWYFKISSLLFDFYINKEPNEQVQRIKYDYLEELLFVYINKEEIIDDAINAKLNSINYESLNKLEYELLKYVIQVSNNYPKTKFNNSDYIYFAMLLEITIQLYNSAFMGISENVVYNILKENLFRFEIVDFKRKQTKMNLLIRYLKFINKNEINYFANLRNKNIIVNVTTLSNHHNYFIIDIINKLPNLLKYDDELVESVVKNNDYLNKLFILNFNLLIEKIVYLLEKEAFKIDKVIFNLDNYQFNRTAINYVNNYDSVINNLIMFCSTDKKKLDMINSKYSKCVYINENKIDKVSEYSGMTVLVKNSFWNKHKIDSKKYKDLDFITIADNIAYKFEKEEN